eukprot:scaffold249314_cov54-Cyclotella_meneghiniana.AAC.2
MHGEVYFGKGCGLNYLPETVYDMDLTLDEFNRHIDCFGDYFKRKGKNIDDVHTNFLATQIGFAQLTAEQVRVETEKIKARMSKIGKDGVAALKKKYGDDAMSKLGKDGVAALKKKYGDDAMSKMGKDGVAALKKKYGDDAMIKKGKHMVATLKKKYGDDPMRKMGKSNMAARVKKHGHDADGKSIAHIKSGKAVAKKYGRNANGKSIAHSRKGKESWADRGIEVRKEALKEFDKTLTVVCGKCKEIIERERPLTMCYRENGMSRRITCSCVDNEPHTDWTVQGQAANQAWKKVDGVWKQYTKREFKKRS